MVKIVEKKMVDCFAVLEKVCNFAAVKVFCFG